jgi:hypothetical protein
MKAAEISKRGNKFSSYFFEKGNRGDFGCRSAGNRNR